MTGAVTAPANAACMPRSREVVRQWQVLRTLAASRLGLTVEALAADHRVTTRTVRRDLAALQRAGFPLYHDSDDLPLRWMLRRAALADLDGGFTLMELCALHFGKAAVEAMASSPLGDDLSGAMDRIEQALPASMRQFLDAIPSVVGAKPAPGSKRLKDTLVASLGDEVRQVEEQGFDLDAITEADLDEPPRLEPFYDLDALDRVLRRPELLPPGVVAEPLGAREYKFTAPGMRQPLRVTTDPEYFDQHASSVELWSPGSPLFPVTDGHPTSSSTEHERESLNALLDRTRVAGAIP